MEKERGRIYGRSICGGRPLRGHGSLYAGKAKGERYAGKATRGAARECWAEAARQLCDGTDGVGALGVRPDAHDHVPAHHGAVTHQLTLTCTLTCTLAYTLTFTIINCPNETLPYNQPIGAVVGDTDKYMYLLTPFGLCLLLLALFPTDAHIIRIVCVLVLLLWTGIGLLLITTSTGLIELGAAVTDPIREDYKIAAASLCFATATALIPTLFCCSRHAMHPRPALRRLWLVTRLFLLGYGVITLYAAIADTVHLDYLDGGNVAVSAVYLLCAALATPRNRGRLHNRVGRLGGRGTEAEEAAAVAALVGGGGDPDAALESATKHFRCLPAGRLHAADLADNKTAPPAGPTLHERTEPAAMGDVTAFLSHSWSDEKEAPGAKHAIVSQWAEQYQESTGQEATLWLVAFAQ